jgi:hypothetical protein
MSALDSPNAPSSIARSTIAVMRASSSAVGARLSRPMTSVRTSVAGTSVPRLIEVPPLVRRWKYWS